MLDIDTAHLTNKKNLLAFSAGVDSSALFFLLIEHHIKFDIAIVDYGIRDASKLEVNHAKKLAKKYKLFCHTINAPVFKTHFEQKARDFRYEFFESLVTIEGYDNILTAHQLNDQLEWMLMRLSKGAGLCELLGLQEYTKKDTYTLVRPLLKHSKNALLHYLQRHNYPYFIDQSNSDEKYERNKFRKQFSEPLMAEYEEGIKHSFEYLRKDKTQLTSGFQTLFAYKSLVLIKLQSKENKIKAADLALKKLGYLLSASQRQEIEREISLVIGGKWAIEIKDNLLYISPYLTHTLPKTFKEQCRRLEIPSKIRPYLFEENIDPSNLISNA